MDLRERSGRVSGQAEGRAERGPVRGAEDVGVFDQHDGLALAGNTGVENGIQVVDGGEIGGHDSVGNVAKVCRYVVNCGCGLRS